MEMETSDKGLTFVRPGATVAALAPAKSGIPEPKLPEMMRKLLAREAGAPGRCFSGSDSKLFRNNDNDKWRKEFKMCIWSNEPAVSSVDNVELYECNDGEGIWFDHRPYVDTIF